MGLRFADLEPVELEPNVAGLAQAAVPVFVASLVAVENPPRHSVVGALVKVLLVAAFPVAVPVAASLVAASLAAELLEVPVVLGGIVHGRHMCA